MGLLARWFGHRRDALEIDESRLQERSEEIAYEVAMADAGWYVCLHRPPPLDEIVQFTRRQWDAPIFCRSSELHPEMNAFGLWWRPIQHDDIEITRAQLMRGYLSR